MKTKVKIGNLELDTPVIAASGCFGFGREFSEYIDLNEIGAISVKGLTLKPRDGNPAPRIAETPSGVLNSVGLQNPGVEAFIRNEIPFLRRYNTKIIANAAGSVVEDYIEMAERLNVADVDALELNLSCPNVKAGCASFGADKNMLALVVGEVRKRYNKTLIVKLTPNVTDIMEIAAAAEASGADAVSLINTLLGMAIDLKTRRPILKNNTGGLSGPAIKPIALRMVHQVYNTVKIPIIGMGGIETGRDAAEFMVAGARAVMVGTANFIDPSAIKRITEELSEYADGSGETDLNSLVGTLKLF